MKASELIKLLVQIVNSEGDLDVCIKFDGAVIESIKQINIEEEDGEKVITLAEEL